MVGAALQRCGLPGGLAVAKGISEAGSGHACLWQFQAVSTEALTQFPRSRPCWQAAAGSPGVRRGHSVQALGEGRARQSRLPSAADARDWAHPALPGAGAGAVAPPGGAGTGARAPAVRSLTDAQAGRPAPAPPCPGSPSVKDRALAPSAGQLRCVRVGGDSGAACHPSQHPECLQACGPSWERLRPVSCWLAGPGGPQQGRGELGVEGGFLGGQRGSESPWASRVQGEGSGARTVGRRGLAGRSGVWVSS